MENSNKPNFKDEIKKFFRTTQNQLKAKFRKRNITTFEVANNYLQDYKIQYNKQYGMNQ